MQKKKIAFIVTPITFGGAEKVNLNFLEHVDRNKFEVVPIVLIRPWETESFFTNKVREFGYNLKEVPVALRPEGDPFRVLRVVKNLYSLMKKEKYDLVHTHGYFANICGVALSNILNIKSVSTCHGFISTDIKLRLYNYIDRKILRMCTRIIAVSETIKQELMCSGIEPSKIVVIPNSVDVDFKREGIEERRRQKKNSLSIAEDEFVIGYAGRLSDEKGITHLVRAASTLREKFIRFKLLIIGDGPARRTLEDQIKASGLAENTLFPGFQEDIVQWLEILDVFVLPSLTEGTPMALLEAMSVGVPVIASSVGGVPQLLNNGVNGFLVSPGQHEEIEEKIIEILKNTGTRNRLVQEGYKTIKFKFNINQWYRAIEREYLWLNQ